MNVGIGNEAGQFYYWEYMIRIFDTLYSTSGCFPNSHRAVFATFIYFVCFKLYFKSLEKSFYPTKNFGFCIVNKSCILKDKAKFCTVTAVKATLDLERKV